MCLAGMQRPDHNTINRFRNDKLKGVLKEVFGQVGYSDGRSRNRGHQDYICR